MNNIDLHILMIMRKNDSCLTRIIILINYYNPSFYEILIPAHWYARLYKRIEEISPKER